MKSFRLLLILFILIPLLTEAATAETLTVPDQYATIAQAAANAADGDIVEIQAGVYAGAGIVATWRQDNLTIRGIDGRAHLDAAGVTISNRKAIWVVAGDAITIENIEFSNARVPDSNGAGIRHEGGDMTLRHCYFHDNENGILTSSNAAAEILIEYSEFQHNGLGSAGYTHNMYIGHIGKFTLRYSYSHHATHGHNVKTRAAENHILYNRIMDETTGNASYQIDIPNGGSTYIIGNTIHQGALAENSRMISYAAEGASNPTQAIFVSGNTFVNDRHIGDGIRLSGTPTARIVNNIFDNINTACVGTPTVFENNIESDANFFVARQSFDFHLTDNSPGRDTDGEPGMGNGIDLTPVFEYIHPLDAAPRADDGQLDAGAFEFDAGMAAPQAVFSTSPEPATGAAPLEVHFTDTSIGTPTSWQWDCDGDGLADASGRDIDYTYMTAGEYTASLTVANTSGSDTATKIITVTVEDPEPINGTGGSGSGGGCFILSAIQSTR